jgi:hypothetical protein
MREAYMVYSGCFHAVEPPMRFILWWKRMTSAVKPRTKSCWRPMPPM